MGLAGWVGEIRCGGGPDIFGLCIRGGGGGGGWSYGKIMATQHTGVGGGDFPADVNTLL